MQQPYVPQVYVPGQQQPNQQQQQQKQLPQVYVPGQQPFAHSTGGQPHYGGGHQPPQQIPVVNAAPAYGAQPPPPPQQQQQQQVPIVTAVDARTGQPVTPEGERGIVSTGMKIAAVAGAATVAYGMYNQYQQSHETGYPGQQQRPPQGAYGQQPMYGQPPPQPFAHSTGGQPHYGAPATAYPIQQQPYYGQAAPPQNQYHQLPPHGTPPQQLGVLTIFLDRATNLANKDVFSKTDPYIRFEIEQDNWLRDYDHGFQVSTKKKDDLNPIYGETFYFNLATLKNMVLKVKVLDDDGFLSRDDKVASCKIKLWELGLTPHPMPVERVIDRNIFTRNGKIFLELSYSGEKPK